jgi:hypothetical protein
LRIPKFDFADKGEDMEDTIKNDDEKGPTEKLRDEAKSDKGELMPEESEVPGAQKPGNQEIKHETGPNTE